ncbi:MAG: CopD family protein [Planctomycetes bacterium]|nr:CopD family protein [Planctomycetota bacterium]
MRPILVQCNFMNHLYLLSVFVHILCAVVWVGGMLFLVMVTMPVFRREGYSQKIRDLGSQMNGKFGRIVWISIVLLVLSGVFNIYYKYRGFEWEEFVNVLFMGEFGTILVIKLITVSVLIVLCYVHDFIIGAKFKHLWQTDPESKESRLYFKTMLWLGRFILVITLAVIILGILLVRPWALSV